MNNWLVVDVLRIAAGANFLLVCVIGIPALRKIQRLIKRAETLDQRQHALRTPVATIDGMVSVLKARAEQHDGFNLQQRQKIYRAIDEQIAAFYRALDSITAE